MDGSLLTLPWQIQFSLAAGYASYALAYLGIRSHHQTIDVAFRTLVFSAIATFIFSILRAGAGDAWAALIALFGSLISGFVWRGFGRSALKWVLERADFAFADDDPTAFVRLYSDTKHHVTQVAVTLQDGTELWCDDTSAFKDAAITPFVLGTDGSVAMYANRQVTKADDGAEVTTLFQTVRDKAWGDRMTLIPASQVRSVDVRYKKKRPS